MLNIPAAIILASLTQAPIGGGLDEAVSIYECDFGSESDRNYDGWPDGWSRKAGLGYPKYVKLKIEREDGDINTANRRLVLRLDGGAAAAFTLKILVHSRFSYAVQARIRVRDLEHDVAFISLRFYDADGKLLEVKETQHIQQADDWVDVRIGPLSPEHNETASAVIGIHTKPVGDDYDIFGVAEFDDIRMLKVPKLSLRGNRDDLIYSPSDEISVTCDLSGTNAPKAKIAFEAVDAYGHVLDSAEFPATGTPIYLEVSSNENRLLKEKQAVGYGFEQSWTPKLPDYGCFQLRVTVVVAGGLPLRRTITAAIVRDLGQGAAGGFGWSIQRTAPVGPKELLKLLPQAGIGWVKYPIWYAGDDTEKADELAWFSERLGNRHIHLVGVLDRPPKLQAKAIFGDREDLPSAFVFSDPDMWATLVNPIVTRLSQKIRYWQLGSDGDFSYVGLPAIDKTIHAVRDHMGRFGQDVEIGVPWRWIASKPNTPHGPMSFYSNVGSPPLTANELIHYLSAEPTGRETQWVMLSPLPAEKYDLDTRIRDLLLRMIASKVGKASVTFIAKPYDDSVGVMRSDGAPGELFLPWRTGTLVLGDSEYLGSMQFPNGSNNRVFASADRAVIAIWNDQPTEEIIYLGDVEDVQVVDVWGRIVRPESQVVDGVVRQRIKVDRLPVFVINANLPIAKWRLNCSLDRTRLKSKFGWQQTVRLRFGNYFGQEVSGELALKTPNVWSVSPQEVRFKSSTDEHKDIPIDVFLQANATSGDQSIRVDFKILSERVHQFSVYRTIHVGMGDVTFEFSTYVDESGILVVEQHFVNRSENEASFNCVLFTPNGRLRRQVLNAARGRRVDTYRLENGADLVNRRLWLRAEEIGGERRVLNYQIRIEK